MKNIIYISFLALNLGVGNVETLASETEASNKTINVGVTISPVEDLAFLPSRNAPARVEALNRTQLASRISGVVEVVSVRVGDQFKAGDVLAKLDCQDKSIELSNQKAQTKRLAENLEFEKRQFIRGKQLAKQKTIGEAELDRLKTNATLAESQLQSQQAMLKNAELAVKRCQIIAPYDGLVVSRVANVGEQLSIGATVMEIIQLNHSEVSALVSLTDIDSYLASDSFVLEANGKRLDLKSRVLLPVVKQTSRTREARLDFTSANELPGATGRVFWYSPFYHLPANLLQQRGKQVGVFVLDNDVAVFFETEGAQEGRPILLNNFEKWRGKKLIVDGRHGLVNGQKVRLKKSKVNSNQNNYSAQPKEG